MGACRVAVRVSFTPNTMRSDAERLIIHRYLSSVIRVFALDTPVAGKGPLLNYKPHEVSRGASREPL